MAFCTNCGAQLSDKAVYCVKCGVAAPQKSIPNSEEALKFVIPIGRSGWAIAAGYLGLLSLLPFFGILALILGVVAVRDIKRHPERFGLGRAWFGIVMGALTSLFYLACIVLVRMSS